MSIHSVKTNIFSGFKNVKYNAVKENYGLIKLVGSEIDADKERMPISIVALVDISGSMYPDYKIGYLRKSLIKMIENLKFEDQLCLITFSTNISKPLELTQMTSENKKKAIGIVSNFQATSSTNISGALSEAYDELKKIEKAENRVVRTILFTDGCPTSGNCNKNHLVEQSSKIPVGQLTTMGYGKPSDDAGTGMSGEIDVKLLQDMADAGKGNYHYMENPDACIRAFAFELAGLLTTVAQGVNVKITPKNHITDLVIMEHDADVKTEADSTIVSLPDIMSEEERYILFKYNTVVQKDAFKRDTNVADIEISYRNMTGDSETVKDKLVLKFVESGEDTALDKEVETQIGIYDAISSQKKAKVMADNGNYIGAQSIIGGAASNLRDIGTLRSTAYSAEVFSMADMVSDRKTYTTYSNTYDTQSYNMSKGRGMSVNSTAFQKDMKAKFDSDIDKPVIDKDFNGNPMIDVIKPIDDPVVDKVKDIIKKCKKVDRF